MVTDQCTDTDTLHDGAPGAPLMVALMSRRRFLSFLFCAMSCSIVLCCSFVSFSSCALRRQMCVCVCVCVCEREREREREAVCGVCVCEHARSQTHMQTPLRSCEYRMRSDYFLVQNTQHALYAIPLCHTSCSFLCLLSLISNYLFHVACVFITSRSLRCLRSFISFAWVRESKCGQQGRKV